MRRPFNIACVLALGATLLTAPAGATEQDVIDYRQHVMKTLNEQTAALGQILATMIPDDNVVTHLEVIALTAQTALKAFEPKVAGGESRPEVWNNWADFSKRMNEFARNTAQAVKTAKAGGKDEVLTNISGVLNCKSCHDIYREEKK